ncbi:cupin domain-containing protein [Pseudonocardiaceae bacterium YIM PH 21723]|nr:cupin domain-containing protein [Pseudonocardiaceae bacterium YIM PH 21723]
MRPPIADALNLQPLPGEGGWYRRTWETAGTSAIYYYLAPGETSAWHILRCAELWLWHSGDPLALHLGGSGSEPALAETVLLGPDLSRGQRPQGLVPADVWQSAESAGDQGTLVTCVCSPAYTDADFRLA